MSKNSPPVRSRDLLERDGIGRDTGGEKPPRLMTPFGVPSATV